MYFAGITIKKIIKIACEVIILLYNWLSAINWTPGPDNSNLINTEYAVPTNVYFLITFLLEIDYWQCKVLYLFE
jgi:hypothetical protein